MAKRRGKLANGEWNSVRREQVTKWNGERKAKPWVVVSAGTKDRGGGTTTASGATDSVEQGIGRRWNSGRFMATPWARGTGADARALCMGT